MAYLRTSVNHLRKDMIIAGDVYTNNGVTLVAAGTPVSKEVIALLTKHFIDSVLVEYKNDIESVTIRDKAEENLIMEEQFQEFRERFQVAEDTLSQNLRNIFERNEDIQVESLIETLNEVIEKVDDDTNLIHMLTRMKKVTTGLYQHSINVALIGQVLAKWLQCSKEDIEAVIIAGLLHDIGFLNVPEEKLRQITFMDELENCDAGKHAIVGYNRIKNQQIDGRIKQAVLTHHERLDGSGFPLQVSHPDINRISCMIAIADIYDILTMEEAGRPAMSAFTALGVMEEKGYGRLDSHLLMRFMTNIADSLIQHRVLLSNGQVGKVIMINKFDISRPLIQTEDSFVDLSQEKMISVKEILD